MQGDGPAASTSPAPALEIQKRSSLRSFPEWAATLQELALLDAGEGRFDAALQGALDAEHMSRDHFRASALGLSERENLARSRARVRDLALAWSWASDLAARGVLSDEAAFRLVDEAIRSRALVLDTLATRQRILALHQDAQTAAAVDTLRVARARLTGVLLDGSTADVAEAQAEADAAERALAEKSRDYRHERRPRSSRVSSMSARQLPQGSALVSYFVSDRGYIACVVRPGASPRIVPLGTGRRSTRLSSPGATPSVATPGRAEPRPEKRPTARWPGTWARGSGTRSHRSWKGSRACSSSRTARCTR